MSIRKNSISENEALTSLEDCLQKNTCIDEVIFSGGDPLTLSNQYLRYAFVSLRNMRPDLRIRIHSRVPVVSPNRIDEEFLKLAEVADPLWFLTHIDLPEEATSEFRLAITKLRKKGFVISSHSVLMKGVNDDAHKLASLFDTLQQLGIVLIISLFTTGT